MMPWPEMACFLSILSLKALSPERTDPRDLPSISYVHVYIYLKYKLTFEGYNFKSLGLNWRCVEFSLADGSN